MDLVKLASVQSCATSTLALQLASQPAAVAAAAAATAVDQVAFVAAVVVVFVVSPLKLVVAAYEKNINFSLLLLLVLCAAQIIVRLTNHCTPQMHLSISYCTSASVYCVLSVILVMCVCVCVCVVSLPGFILIASATAAVVVDLAWPSESQL